MFSDKLHKVVDKSYFYAYSVLNIDQQDLSVNYSKWLFLSPFTQKYILAFFNYVLLQEIVSVNFIPVCVRDDVK